MVLLNESDECSRCDYNQADHFGGNPAAMPRTRITFSPHTLSVPPLGSLIQPMRFSSTTLSFEHFPSGAACEPTSEYRGALTLCIVSTIWRDALSSCGAAAYRTPPDTLTQSLDHACTHTLKCLPQLRSCASSHTAAPNCGVASHHRTSPPPSCSHHTTCYMTRARRCGTRMPEHVL